MMHNSEFSPTYHTKNTQQSNHITPQVFNKKNREITHTTLATQKLMKRHATFVI